MMMNSTDNASNASESDVEYNEMLELPAELRLNLTEIPELF